LRSISNEGIAIGKLTKAFLRTFLFASVEKKRAIFLALAITLVIALDYWYFSASIGDERNLESAVVARVLDGDTFDLTDGRRVRMLNINTPEKGEFGADNAKTYLKQFENKTVEISVIGRETYGRLLARVYAPNYINLNMVREGLARTLLVQDEEVKEFARAQQEAIEGNRGVWARSANYGCLAGEIDKKDEYVEFENRCAISLAGWTVSDETTREYTFKTEPAERFVLYSARGSENKTALFWKRVNAWNNDRDALIVRDEQGKLVYYNSYGY